LSRIEKGVNRKYLVEPLFSKPWLRPWSQSAYSGDQQKKKQKQSVRRPAEELTRRQSSISDKVSYDKSDLELDAFPDRQPVKFIADDGRNADELRNTHDQPRSRVEDGLKSVKTISIRPVEDTVTIIDSACDEGVNKRQQDSFVNDRRAVLKRRR